MEDTNELRPETPLDEALESARRNPDKPNDFYDALLNSDLVVPVFKEGSKVGTWQQLGLNDRFHPLFATVEGKKIVPVFDQIGRLKQWAAERTVDFLDIRCHVLLQLLGKDVGLLLNPGTPWHHPITPDIVDLLRRAMKPVTRN